MKRFLMLVPWVAVGISILGLTSEGSATARITQSGGTHRAHAHVINLRAAYEARLGHTTLGTKPAGIVYPRNQPPAITGRGGNNCAEPYCPVYYQGGLVQHNPHVYLLLWGPNWSSDPSQAATASWLENFYAGLGVQPQDNWSPITSQYGDTTGNPGFNGTVYEGFWQDVHPPPTGVDANGLATEADTFASQQGITDLTDAQIIVATQSGTCPQGFYAPTCSGGSGYYCAWHDSSNEPFTNLPYLLDAGSNCGEDFVNSNGTYDGLSVVGGHEYAETVTDPYPFTGWRDPYDQSNGEIADKCAWSPQSSDVSLSTGTFAMQPLWDNGVNGANGCEMYRLHNGDITLDSPGTQSDYQEVKGISLQMIGTSRYGYELTWSASGLPSGLTINTSSGLISGQVTGAPGTYSVTVSASDPTVTSPPNSPPTANFSWTVNADVGSLITNKGSGLCLNDSHWVTTPGNEIFLWKCGGSAAEDFSHPTNGGKLIVFGQCMTDPHPSGSGGQLEVIDPCAGKLTQEYYLNRKGEYIVNKLCLTDPANATQNGTPVVLEPCTGASDQLWVGS